MCEDAGKMPSWLRKELPDAGTTKDLSRYLSLNSIETVCANSRCPNASECYASGNISFLILGRTCTRGCLFCAVRRGVPGEINPAEALSIAASVRKMDLKYVVITSVARDDIPGGGSGHYARVVRAVKDASPLTAVEALVPDFNGSEKAVDDVMGSGVSVFSHNMETVHRLHRQVRPDFDYFRSLEILRYAARTGAAAVKSGFMLGLGESEDEIYRLLRDIKGTGCALLTIGQYLQPKGSPLKVRKYIPPEDFIALKERALKLGFRNVASGPFVRSSYRAGELFAGSDKQC